MAGSIVNIDCIAGEDSKETVAQSFAEFLSKVGRDTANDA
jgi:cell wall assembly regulator SMI1